MIALKERIKSNTLSVFENFNVRLIYRFIQHFFAKECLVLLYLDVHQPNGAILSIIYADWLKGNMHVQYLTWRDMVDFNQKKKAMPLLHY